MNLFCYQILFCNNIYRCPIERERFFLIQARLFEIGIDAFHITSHPYHIHHPVEKSTRLGITPVLQHVRIEIWHIDIAGIPMLNKLNSWTIKHIQKSFILWFLACITCITTKTIIDKISIYFIYITKVNIAKSIYKKKALAKLSNCDSWQIDKVKCFTIAKPIFINHSTSSSMSENKLKRYHCVHSTWQCIRV